MRWADIIFLMYKSNNTLSIPQFMYDNNMNDGSLEARATVAQPAHWTGLVLFVTMLCSFRTYLRTALNVICGIFWYLNIPSSLYKLLKANVILATVIL